MSNTATTPELATRRARAIASDIALYNEEKVKQGLEQDNLFELLEDEITEGRDYFKSSTSPEFHDNGTFERAIVDVIIARKGYIASDIW